MTTSIGCNSENVCIKPDKDGHVFARFSVHGHVVHIESRPDSLWFFDTGASITGLHDIIGTKICAKCEKCGGEIPA